MFPEVQSPLQSNTLDSEDFYCEQVLAYQVSASLHPAGDTATEMSFPVTTLWWPINFFSTRWLMPHRKAHQELSWSHITWLESSSAVFSTPNSSNPQLHFHKHHRSRQAAHEQPCVTGSSQQHLLLHHTRQHIEEAEATILHPPRGPSLQEVQCLSSCATVGRVFAHPAHRYRFLRDKFGTAFQK